MKSISDYLLDQKWEHFEPLFGLSSDEEGQVQSVLSRVSTFDSQVLEQKFGRAGEVYKSAKDGRKLGGLRCRNVEDKRFEININTIRQSKKYFVA